MRSFMKALGSVAVAIFLSACAQTNVTTTSTPAYDVVIPYQIFPPAPTQLCREQKNLPQCNDDVNHPIPHVDISVLSEVKASVEETFVYQDDRVTYGESEYWNMPTMDNPVGDCEDYVLLVSAELIKRGIPWANQAMIVAREHNNSDPREYHALLAIKANNTVYVIDSNTSEVMTWDTAYIAYDLSTRSYWGKSIAGRWSLIPYTRRITNEEWNRQLKSLEG